MDYVAARSSTAEKLKVNGKSIDFQYMNGMSINGTHEVYALELKMSIKDIDGTNIRMGDKLFMMAAIDETGLVLKEPRPGDRIVTEGNIYSIVQVFPLSPGDIAIYYEVLCRG